MSINELERHWSALVDHADRRSATSGVVHVADLAASMKRTDIGRLTAPRFKKENEKTERRCSPRK